MLTKFLKRLSNLSQLEKKYFLWAVLACTGCTATMPSLPEGVRGRSLRSGEGGIVIDSSGFVYRSSSENCCLAGKEALQNSFLNYNWSRMSFGIEGLLPWSGSDYLIKLNWLDGLRLRLKRQIVETGKAEGNAVSVFGDIGISAAYLTSMLGVARSSHVRSADFTLGADVGYAHFLYSGSDPDSGGVRLFYKSYFPAARYDDVYPDSHYFIDLFTRLDWSKLGLFAAVRQFLPLEFRYPNARWSTNGQPVIWRFSPMLTVGLAIHFGR